jgi:translation initiation factor 2 alpha subunit (eIF-2alpha)
MVFLYKDKKPSIGSITCAKITEINETIIIVELPDYDNLKGYISYSELPRRKKRVKLHSVVHVGKEIVVQVTSVVKNEDYVELSIRILIPEDIEQFTFTHKKYVNLYNLWRYIYMKLKSELYTSIQISEINNDDINIFMTNTFWKIQNQMILNNDEDEHMWNPDVMYNILLDTTDNLSLIKYITDYDVNDIKKIFDNYSQLKKVLVKQTKSKEFTLCSYNKNGLEDIKTTLNYKTFDKYPFYSDKYEIKISYLTGFKYLITIEQKTPIDNDDIDTIIDYFIKEIINKSHELHILFN